MSLKLNTRLSLNVDLYINFFIWNTSQCTSKFQHFLNSRGQCIPCGCAEIGSVSMSCDAVTGQCECKSLYTGRQCDRCEVRRIREYSKYFFYATPF